MEANLNINPNDDDDLKKFEGCLGRLILIAITIVVTIIVYYAKK